MRSRMRATAASRRASWKRSTTAAVKDGVTTRRPSCVESCDGCGDRPPALLHLPHLLCIHKCDLQVLRGGICTSGPSSPDKCHLPEIGYCCSPLAATTTLSS